MGKLAGAAGSGTNLQTVGNEIFTGYTGYDQGRKQWDTSEMLAAWGPIIVGVAISVLASKTGLNKYLPSGVNF